MGRAACEVELEGDIICFRYGILHRQLVKVKELVSHFGNQLEMEYKENDNKDGHKTRHVETKVFILLVKIKKVY